MHPMTFAARWLLPRLANLKKAVPHCDPWIDTSGANVDFEEMEVSIAILRAREVGSNLVSQSLFADALVPVASPTSDQAANQKPALISQDSRSSTTSGRKDGMNGSKVQASRLTKFQQDWISATVIWHCKLQCRAMDCAGKPAARARTF